MAAYLGHTAERGSAGESFGQHDEKVAARRDRGAAIRIYGALVILLSITMGSGFAMLKRSIMEWISGGIVCESR